MLKLALHLLHLHFRDQFRHMEKKVAF